MAEATGTTAGDRPAGLEFRDPSTLLRWVTGLLVLCSLAAAVTLVLRILEYRLLMQIGAGAFASQNELMAAAAASDTRVQAAGGIRAVFFLAACIPFGMWIYRANKNARALGAANMKYGPGWAVGWYFVPFANFVAPFLTMREIWRASLDPGNWPAARSTPLLGWWWFLWLTSALTGSLGASMVKHAKGLDAVKAASVMASTQNVFQIALCVVAILLLRRITANQLWQSRLVEVF